MHMSEDYIIIMTARYPSNLWSHAQTLSPARWDIQCGSFFCLSAIGNFQSHSHSPFL